MMHTRTQGQQFVSGLIILLILVIFIYVISHSLVSNFNRDGCDNTKSPNCNVSLGQINWQQFADIDDLGEVSFFNFSDIDWYLGADRAAEVIKLINERNTQIIQTRIGVRTFLQKLEPNLEGKSHYDALSKDIMEGEYEKAYLQFDLILSTLGTSTKEKLDVVSAGKNIHSLIELKSKQLQDLEKLSPPLPSLFFWTTPTLSIFEVLFWSLFGVITNLLVNSAEYLRKNKFVPAERWVAYTKLVYGPILSMVLVLALINGWFSVPEYNIRVWTLPLVAFVFGYASRKTARLFDKVIERFLGKTEEGIMRGPGPVMAERKKTYDMLYQLAKPASFNEVTDQAKTLAKGYIEVESAKRDATK